MEAISPEEYFYFGTVVRYLQDASVGLPIHEPECTLANLSDFFRFLNTLGLQVTARASYKIRDLQGQLQSTALDSTLTSEQATRLKYLVTQIRETLTAELWGFKVYLVSPKRIDVKKLTTEVPHLFAPSVFDCLPDIAKYDLTEAGKCIAFERPTAAAFHLLRATESVLRAFYCHRIKRNRCASLLWGPIVQDMRSKRQFSDKPEFATLFNNLDNIRLSFRNPTQHPEKIYDIEEVQDLWGLCVDVITRMARHLPAPIHPLDDENEYIAP